ncbi:hypothetical protein G6F35_009404 [Rhizopus arrhizus]|nr:hypothetical protein G6F35_009404 [Rhizopus arrhizus]
MTRREGQTMTSIKDKRVLVTGAGRGLGATIAHGFAGQGATVIVADIDAALAAGTAQAIRDAGGHAVDARLDVTDAGAVRAFAAHCAARHGNLDILINNAGISANKPTLEVTVDEWRRAVDINLTGVFLCAQAAGRRMVPAGSGSIINLASMYGVVAAPDRAAYCATKGAVVLLTETLAVEWGPMGVRVNALAPGYVETDLVRDLAARGRLDPERLKQRTPLRRMAQPAEMADLAVFLASRQAAYITGHTLVADGGWSRYSYL